MTFSRIWIAWLLALVFGFAEPAQAMRGLTGLGTPLRAKSHSVNNPINHSDPTGMVAAGVITEINLTAHGTNLFIELDSVYGSSSGLLTKVAVTYEFWAHTYGHKDGKECGRKWVLIQSDTVAPPGGLLVGLVGAYSYPPIRIASDLLAQADAVLVKAISYATGPGGPGMDTEVLYRRAESSPNGIFLRDE